MVFLNAAGKQFVEGGKRIHLRIQFLLDNSEAIKSLKEISLSGNFRF
jgi:hypothetical protein